MPKSTLPKTPGQEWSMLCNIGWTEQDVPKLRQALATLKDAQNITELRKFLQRYPVSGKKVAKTSTIQTASSSTVISQHGLIKMIDNGAIVDYQIGNFSYLCERNAVIVTKKSGRGTVNVAQYVYKTDEEALDCGYKMARKQESIEKAILTQQKASVKTTTATAKKQRQTQKVTVKF
jgi:hypothetical protein